MSLPLKVLIAEDSENDALLISMELERGGYDPACRRIETPASMAEALEKEDWDIIIADYSMPVFSGLDALGVRNEKAPDIPFILVSGVIDEEAAVEAMIAGAGDYVSKERLSRLAPAVKREIESRKVKRRGERAEEAVRDSEERYQSIFENVREGIFQISPNGLEIHVNPSLARMCGYDSPGDFMKEVGRADLLPFVNPEDRMRIKGAFIRDRKVEGFEARIIRKDGRIATISVDGWTALTRDGAVARYEGTVEDITERTRAEEEKRKLESQLKQAQKMEALGALAGGVAHDFNNILTVLTGYGTLLQMKMEKENPLRVYADHILSATQRAAGLVQSLLAFSRKQPIILSSVNLNNIVKATEKLLVRLLSEDIVLRTVLTAEEATVRADATQIDQILFNLASNARDAMPKGGTLTIETSMVSLDTGFTMTHGFGGPGRYALLTVSDTGKGMDEMTREHIFEPFFTTKEAGRGTGLGLSTVYGIVTQHNGFVEVESEEGKGTTFRIYLPASRPVIGEERPAAARIRKGSETILIAEDNEGVRHLMRTVLTTYGYRVVEAVDGEDALEKFRRLAKVDLLIIDSVMPKLNGREVYDEITKVNPGVKALFTSGYTRDVVLDKGIEEGEFDFLPKPILPGDMLRKVREILDR